MDPNDLRWVLRLYLTTAWGMASAINRTPPPSDDELWATARIRPDLHLSERTDQRMLAQLRAAFNRGRFPTGVDVQTITDEWDTDRPDP